MVALGRLKTMLPWWAKIAAKLILARLPLGGHTWQSLGLFSPGEMHDPDYALNVFDSHYQAAGRPVPGFRYVELGPGDSLASAVIAKAHGAAGGWLIDSGAYASRDMGLYGALAARLEVLHPGSDVEAIKAVPDVDAMLMAVGARYLETGLAGLREVPDASCDMVFSQAVLEHVPRAEFAATLVEIHRILKPGGISTHQVDFRDHLGGGLNNLRFSENLWEAPWFARRSGFYTNRLRLSEMTEMMQGAGFTVELEKPRRSEVPPMPRARLAPMFQGLSDDDLATWEAFIMLRKTL
jgi:SAM-dependent methyltransferase